MKKINYIKEIQQIFYSNTYYKTIFTKNLFSIKNKLLHIFFSSEKKNKIKKKILIIIDQNVALLHKNLLNNIKNYCVFYSRNFILQAIPLISQGGEVIKNDYHFVKKIYKYIHSNKICRHSYIIVIGGGSLLDAVGFATATAHRGVKLIRIPTTTLSQNDSGVGIKNGINFFKKKNFIGTFNTAEIILNDFYFLHTLKKEIYIEGIAEALKISLIRNYYFFQYIKKNSQKIINLNIYIMTKINYVCAYLHIRHIGKSNDPFEKHSSRPLDFGHWLAHKIESITHNKTSHGQAVAIGIAVDCTYSYFINLLTKKLWKSIIETILSMNLKIYNKITILENFKKSRNFFKASLNEFKEHLGGQLTITLLKEIGKGVTVNTINTKIMYKSLNFLKKITKHT